MANVDLKSVSKIYRTKKREEIHAVSQLTFQVADHELVALVGPSGSGKTTTLRLIAGLDEITDGTISLDNVAVNNATTLERDVSMIFQRDALYSHMTVFENMAFGARLRSVPRTEIETRVRSTAATLGLVPILNRYPTTLSGGQRQRVAVGRALVRQPRVLLLDEPFSSIDAPMRSQLRAEVAQLNKQLGTTMIYVTHDQAEAMMLGQRIVVLKEGILQQVADPLTLYHRPANLFVAGFIGSPPMNLFRGRITANGGEYQFEENNPAGASRGSRFKIALGADRAERLIRFAEGNIVLGLHAEQISVRNAFTAQDTFRVSVEVIEHLGAETRLYFNTGAHAFVARVESTVQHKVGDELSIQFEMQNAVFFNPASGAPIT
jgi:multiple sugar transport system ATP-binding protein